MRLIDAETLWKAITTRIEECCDIADLGEIIETQPTIDAVPVVRCKDCKWYKTNYSWNGKEHRVCVIEPYEPVRKADDFCSRAGKKKE